MSHSRGTRKAATCGGHTVVRMAGAEKNDNYNLAGRPSTRSCLWNSAPRNSESPGTRFMPEDTVKVNEGEVDIMASSLIKLPDEIKVPQGIDDVTPIQIEITNPIAARLVFNNSNWVQRLG